MCWRLKRNKIMYQYVCFLSLVSDKENEEARETCIISFNFHLFVGVNSDTNIPFILRFSSNISHNAYGESTHQNSKNLTNTI